LTFKENLLTQLPIALATQSMPADFTPCRTRYCSSLPGFFLLLRRLTAEEYEQEAQSEIRERRETRTMKEEKLLAQHISAAAWKANGRRVVSSYFYLRRTNITVTSLRLPLELVFPPLSLPLLLARFHSYII
jgi:hypothetical protein